MIYIVKSALDDDLDIEQSLLIPTHFLKSMKDLYRKRRNYKTIIKLAEFVLEKEQFIDKRVIEDVRYFLCLTLARMRDARFLKEVMNINGPEHNFLMGFYYRKTGNLKESLKRFESIINEPYILARVKGELVQVYIQMDEYDKALNYAKENYYHHKGNPFFIHSYFNCVLHSSMDFEEKNRILTNLHNELTKVKSGVGEDICLRTEAKLKSINGDKLSAYTLLDKSIKEFPYLPYAIIEKFDVAFIRRQLTCPVRRQLS